MFHHFPNGKHGKSLPSVSLKKGEPIRQKRLALGTFWHDFFSHIGSSQKWDCRILCKQTTTRVLRAIFRLNSILELWLSFPPSYIVWKILRKTSFCSSIRPSASGDLQYPAASRKIGQALVTEGGGEYPIFFRGWEKPEKIVWVFSKTQASLSVGGSSSKVVNLQSSPVRLFVVKEKVLPGYFPQTKTVAFTNKLLMVQKSG